MNNNNNIVSSDLIRGHIDTIILRSLYFGDRYGYDIIKEIEQKTGGEYKLKQPTLYSCLKRLEDQGFTSSYWGAKSMGGRKKYYTLTDMGRQLFIKNQTDWQRSRQIIEKLIEGEEFEINASRPRVFEKTTVENSEHIDGAIGTANSGNQIYSQNLSAEDVDNADEADEISESEVAATTVSLSNDESETEDKFSDVFLPSGIITDKDFEGFENSVKFEDEASLSGAEKFDNFTDAEYAKTEDESEDEKRYDNFEAIYDANPDFFKEKERYDNFSGYVPPPPEPYKPAIFIREETEDDVAAAAAYEAAEVMRQKTFTKSAYELDQNGEIINEEIIDASENEFGNESAAIENDLRDSTAETFYLKQKDKPSYIDDVSCAPYCPSTAPETEDCNFLCDDELPYAEHLLKEYGDDQNDSDSDINDDNDDDTDGGEAANRINNEYYDLGNGKQGDVNELPYEFDALNEKSFESKKPQSSAEDDFCDVNELPYVPSDESGEIHGDDGIELPQSERFEERRKEDDITKSFLKYEQSSLSEVKDEEIITRQYHAALSRLIRKQKPKYSPDPFVQNKLEKTAASAAQMGDEMIVRKHSDTVKEYNSENYYYNNRLRLWQYGILFVIMLLETVVTFAICELFIHKAIITMTELWIYIFGVVLSMALPAIAFALAQLNLNKRKKADHDFKSSMIFRVLLCALLFLIIFLVNSYFGILTNNFSDYLAKFIYPMVLATNIVTSGLIFNKLYKSKKFKGQ